MNARKLQLDYFQIYDIEIPKDVRELSPKVRLRGQFDTEEGEWAKPQFLKKFANPVSKNGEPIFDKIAHLTWYNMNSTDPAVLRNVTIENQFGKQVILTYDVRGLLVPALKRKPGSVFPRPTKLKLDHYKIYRVINVKRVDKSVKLEDQFHKREATVYHPVAFAVPVSKEHHGKVFPIHNSKAHLTIYQVEQSKDMPDMIDARDQFGLHRYLKMGVSYLLAVPSKKLEVKEG